MKRKLTRKKKHVFEDPTVEEVVEQEVEFKDPKTGKLVKQLVKVKKLKVIKREERAFVGANDMIDNIEKDESIADLDMGSED